MGSGEEMGSAGSREPVQAHRWIYVRGQVLKHNDVFGELRAARAQGTSGGGRWNGNRDEAGEEVEKPMGESVAERLKLHCDHSYWELQMWLIQRDMCWKLN